VSSDDKAIILVILSVSISYFIFVALVTSSAMHNTLNSIIDLNRSYSAIYSTKAGNFWSISFSDIISIFLGSIAVWVSLPNLIGVIVGYIYRPKIEAFFPPAFHYETNATVLWSDLNNVLNIINYSPRYFLIEIEITVERRWQPNRRASSLFPYEGIQGEDPRGFWYKSRVFDICGRGILALMLPFIPEPENNSLEILIYPRIKLSSLKFPTFYGDVHTRIIKETFIVTGT
jgi:hypothetical protein